MTHPRRRALIVLGACLALIGVTAVVGGGLLLHLHSAKTDKAGFYASGFHPLRTPTSALVAEKLAIGADRSSWPFRKRLLGTFRVTATGSTARPVFVGVARQAQVDRYLRGVRYDEIADFDLGPFSVTKHRHGGSARASRPDARGIWTASATGTGKQSVRWHVQRGDWAIVVMNADGTPGVATSVSVAAKLPILFWLALALVTGGSLVAVGGGLLLVAGAVRRAGPEAIRPQPATRRPRAASS
jgi:hypothetical protein